MKSKATTIEKITKQHPEIFPLQTVQSMADRWKMSRQSVAMRVQRDPHFPRPVDGLIARTSRTPRVFSFDEVKAYEEEKGLYREI